MIGRTMVRRLGVLAALIGAPALAQWQSLPPLSSYELKGSVATLQCGAAVVRLEAVNEQVVRVRLAPDGHFGRDFSWAVLDLTPKGRFALLDESPARIRFSAGALVVVVQRDPCRLEIHDAEDRVLTADELTRGMSWCGGASAVRAWQQLPDEVAIYGLGEKSGPLDKNGRAWTMWNTDAGAYGPSTDPLYKSVPFFIVAQGERYHGVFLDNPWRSSFDFGQQDRGVLSFGAEGGELNYYVIAGPDPKDVVRRYTDLTGRMELPPLWAIGYHQCRYSYYPEARVREVADTFRAKHIPCDVLWFDIDYMNGYRCFTWNDARFPDPKRMMDDLHAQGFHTVAIIDPGIKNEPGYPVFDSGTKIGAWLTRPDGQPYVGRVWPGATVFPDFTSPKARNWWSDQFPPFLQACGLDGVWNDMNEPADFDGPNHTVPLDVRFDNEGAPAPHGAVHNVYGMQMARASKEGIRRARPGQRAFTLTRASYAGGQRYGAGWTGDNMSTWEHLSMSLPMCLNLGVSGMPFVGPDIGGFIIGATPEMYARWIQMAGLFPFCRTHTGWGNPDQEPWSYGPEVEAVARQALERRYALLPYLYTLFEEASRTGLPIIRPLWLEFPGTRSWVEDFVFLLGRDLYVAPVLLPGARATHRQLPPGVWFDMNTGLIHGDGQPVRIDPKLDTLPMFVRAGAIIPMQSPVQNTTETPEEPLILDVWPFGESDGTLYEDDGATEAYRQGAYRRTSFHCAVKGDEIRLTLAAPEGTFVPRARSPLVRLHGLASGIAQVTQVAGDQKPIVRERPAEHLPVAAPGEFHHESASNVWWVRLAPDDGKPQEIRVKLAPPAGTSVPPVCFEFSDAAQDIAYSHDVLPPLAKDGTVHLRVQSVWSVSVILPRVRFSAERLPALKLRAATGHAKQIRVAFATEQDPTLSERSEMTFDVTADGQLHDYRFDLAKASQGKWAGTVYWVRLGFGEGITPGDEIVLDQLCFE
jgi:alpha-glucosidase